MSSGSTAICLEVYRSDDVCARIRDLRENQSFDINLRGKYCPAYEGAAAAAATTTKMSLVCVGPTNVFFSRIKN